MALILRLVFASNYVSSHPARALATIPFLFEPGNIAYSLATGHGFASPFRVDTGPTAWMTPVYPLLLAGIFRLFGTYTIQAFLAAIGLNILFSTATCVPLWFAGKRLGAPVAAPLLWALFPNAILLPYESLWDASLSALLAATILWATLAVAESDRLRDWIGCGLLWGLALMTNAALVALLPFQLGWAAWRHRRAKPLVAAAAIVLCCLPWTIRNYRVFHAFVPLRSVAGLALWLGNNDDAGTLTPGRLHPISNQAERDKYVAMGEIDYMREKQSLAVHYLFTHPATEARLIAERFVAIWSGGSAHLIRDFRNARTVRFYVVVLCNLIAALGALTGIVLLWREHSPYAFPLTAFPLIFPLAYYLTLAPPRYRHPIDPALLLLTAIAITHLPNYRKRPSPVRKSK
ncbi:MAG TPA: glycosyltransferase family 39 protein [Bryobacteraceae bacterium]|nr:glycosyltransferase family 39 protein [Bryobacteraceae bacterium]